jgi:glucose/arabinose dehydrogenase
MRNWQLGVALLALLVSGCQLVSSRGVSSTFTPDVATGPGAATAAEASTTGPDGSGMATASPQPPLSPTPFPPAPSETALPSATLASPTATPISNATAFPDPANYTWTPIVGGLNLPVAMTNAGDGSGRLFVLERAGLVRVVREGQLDPTPFLDIRDRVGSSESEQGLLGIVFHPDFPENGYFYVNYTDYQGNTVIARFQASPDLNQASPASELRLLQVGQPFPNHNGGGLAFGPDGMLYVALGDGGAAGDPLGNAQSLDTFLGKLLRLDVSSGEPYEIPGDNPFVNGGGLLEIWAYGLRNPWRIAFDRLIGDLFIGDVGQGTYEEIDFQPAGTPGGRNYGWDYMEGFHSFAGSPPAAATLTEPVAEYSHNLGCSVTGGEVYRGPGLPDWQGIYFYGDYCSGRVWGLLRGSDGVWQNQLLFQIGQRITSFGVDETGELYLVGYNGQIFRLENR